MSAILEDADKEPLREWLAGEENEIEDYGSCLAARRAVPPNGYIPSGEYVVFLAPGGRYVFPKCGRSFELIRVTENGSVLIDLDGHGEKILTVDDLGVVWRESEETPPAILSSP